MCFIGLSVYRPVIFGVGSPSFVEAKACANSCSVNPMIIPGKDNRTANQKFGLNKDWSNNHTTSILIMLIITHINRLHNNKPPVNGRRLIGICV